MVGPVEVDRFVDDAATIPPEFRCVFINAPEVKFGERNTHSLRQSRQRPLPCPVMLVILNMFGGAVKHFLGSDKTKVLGPN
jgi:hypothetical protein